MLADSWVITALGKERLEHAREAADRQSIQAALGLEVGSDASTFDVVLESVELAALDILDAPNLSGLSEACDIAFRLIRATCKSETVPLERLVRMSALGVLAGKSPDVSRSLKSLHWQSEVDTATVWSERVRDQIYIAWLRLCRKDGWTDLDECLQLISDLRKAQLEFESDYLKSTHQSTRTAGWELIAYYHTARAIELLAQYTISGSIHKTFDVEEQLDAQYERATVASTHGQNIELENQIRLLHAASRKLAADSIWTSARSVSSRVTTFVNSLVSRENQRPFFELLPPQRKALTEENLIGSSFRSIVLSLPTSSGKTLIAQFRILQALGQFQNEEGWVAYLAPTRVLVNQVTRTLRKRFAPLSISVERVSPALEVDNVESQLLRDQSTAKFQVLVTTPEKFDLLLRGGWEENIGRPLTLVIVDEAHNIGAAKRGITLELLLATINRECRYAQFLLLTPFIENATEVARWLDRNSYRDITVGLDWRPNDVAVAIAKRVKGLRGNFSLDIETVFTSRRTIAVQEAFVFPASRPLGLSYSQAQGLGKLAAATRQIIKEHGTAIILAQTIPQTWAIADTLAVQENIVAHSDNVSLAQRYLRHEFGDQFDLVKLLNYGVAVHHSGLSDETKVLVEDLLERGDLNTVVATTTVAQGVNFPVSSVIMANHQYPYGQDMPSEDFWNLAGRVGRVDQDELGLVLLVADDDERAQMLKTFVNRSAGKLVSTLIGMVRATAKLGEALQLSTLYRYPEWSHFLQYLVHTYRIIGDRRRFAAEVEQILRGTLGFNELRVEEPVLARRLINQVQRYASNLSGQPLSFVDQTGFSLESVKAALANLRDERIDQTVWDRDTLFESNDRSLAKLIGVLLRVPELREQLDVVIDGRSLEGRTVADLLKRWVSGESIPDLATRFFGGSASTTQAISNCCRELFGGLAGTAAWGLSALQSLTLGVSLEGLPETERARIRNIPAMVQYGVGSDGAIALRLLGVPRTAATRLSATAPFGEGLSLAELRELLSSGNSDKWTAAMGSSGLDYFAVWRLVEGIEAPVP